MGVRTCARAPDLRLRGQLGGEVGRGAARACAVRAARVHGAAASGPEHNNFVFMYNLCCWSGFFFFILIRVRLFASSLSWLIIFHNFISIEHN